MKLDAEFAEIYFVTYLSAKYPNTVTATKIPTTNTDFDIETNHCRSHTKSHCEKKNKIN